MSQWAYFKTKTVIIVGDVNLERLRLDRSEGKILKDLEEVNDLHYLINEPTRVTANSQTRIDVMLTNNPDLFKNYGVYNPEFSDQSIIYGEMTEKVKKHSTKTLVHRQTSKATDFYKFNKDLLDAPWHVGEIFDDLDDAYDYWRNLFDSIENEHAPMRKKWVREKDVGFMSKEWKTTIKNKRKYATQFAKDRTSKNFELKGAFSIYKTFRKISIGNFRLGRERSICHKSHSFPGPSPSLHQNTRCLGKMFCYFFRTRLCSSLSSQTSAYYRHVLL